MRAYCDGNEDQIVSAINDVKGKACIVRTGSGVRIIRD